MSWAEPPLRHVPRRLARLHLIAQRTVRHLGDQRRVLDARLVEHVLRGERREDGPLVRAFGAAARTPQTESISGPPESPNHVLVPGLLRLDDDELTSPAQTVSEHSVLQSMLLLALFPDGRGLGGWGERLPPGGAPPPRTSASGRRPGRTQTSTGWWCRPRPEGARPAPREAPRPGAPGGRSLRGAGRLPPPGARGCEPRTLPGETAGLGGGRCRGPRTGGP